MRLDSRHNAYEVPRNTARPAEAPDAATSDAKPAVAPCYPLVHATLCSCLMSQGTHSKSISSRDIKAFLATKL